MNNWARGVIGITIATLMGCMSPSPILPLPVTPSKKNHPDGVYTVRTGDTLYTIAWRFGLDYRDIIATNKLQQPYTVYAGQHLKLAASSNIAPSGLGNPPVINRHLPANYLAPITPKKAVAASQQKWVWPTSGHVVKSFTLEGTHPNKGIDIIGKIGQPIYAAAAGEVVYSGNGIPGYGNLIIIKHDTLYLTAYAHNQKNRVKEGEKVKQGQNIATMGQSEAKQADLHFEVRYAGKPVNPLRFLPKL